MIVVDANVVASLVMPGESAELAEALHRFDPEWVAPSLIVSELLSVLHKGVRARRWRLADAEASLGLALELVGERQVDPEPALVLRLAERSSCTTYDCEYVAAAEMFDCVLATFDAQLLKAFPGRAIHPERLLAG
ncbi:MAG: type II toxin-antitoxin system VapC family toxin [Gemmatimonadetes bacterium]|nr:type II toxin-antitoxin system VapC family toxin [Gemmatimonadota bacterium]